MKAIPALVAALLALQDPAPTTLTLVPDGAAKPGELEKASKALQKRLVDFGYTGVDVKVVESEVAVSCESGITTKMRPWIEHFASLPASKVEIAFEQALNQAQRQQYDPGKTAPPGTTWASAIINPFYPTIPREWRLFKDKPRLVVTGHLKWVTADEKNPSHFELSGPQLKAFKEMPSQTMFGMQFLIDGQCSMSGGAELRYPDLKAAHIYWTSQDNHVGICLNNPMPIALKLKK